MDQEIHITLRFHLSTGKVNLNEIVYKLKKINHAVMIGILESILKSYDNLICDRLSHTCRSTLRNGLGRHFTKSKTKPRCLCRGRKVIKRGYRSQPRHFKTVFGPLVLPLRVVECIHCGARYSPLLSALKIGLYSRKESNFEQEVIEAVIDTNYRRLIEGRSIDISLGGIHNIVVGSDIDREYEKPVDLSDFSAVMADGTGVKQFRGKKGELRAVIGLSPSGKVEPLGCFTNTDWADIERTVKERIKKAEQYELPFIYDGEPGLDTFLSDIAESQRCAWHGPRGLYHALWEDGLKKKDSKIHIDKLKCLVGIELPEDDYEILKEQDKEKVKRRYESSKSEIDQLIELLRTRGYSHGASYLENLSERLFTNIEIWLRTGVIAPRTISLLERLFRELGRRLKKIAWGWADKTVTKLSKMILLKQYSREKWETYWKKKLGISGNFDIQLISIAFAPCQHF